MHDGERKIPIHFGIERAREKERDLTQFYDKSPHTRRKIQKVT